MATLELKLKRVVFGKNYTEGWLFIDQVMFCDTLEDKTRDYNKDGDLDDAGETKIYGETAIPFGRYRVIISYSPKFKKRMLEIIGVKHFGGIRFHSGLKPKDTLGCVLVGKYSNDGEMINDGSSGALFKVVETAEKDNTEVWITIE